MPTFKSFDVSSKNEETGKTEVIGQVSVPLFDEENTDVGLKEIGEYDWTKDGYRDAAHAIVSLVNTQHGTNLRNKLRQSKSGKVSAAAIEAEAMSRCTLEELQKVIGDPAKFTALKEQKIAVVKAEIEAKKKSNAAAVTTNATPEDQAKAAAADAQTEAEVVGGATK